MAQPKDIQTSRQLSPRWTALLLTLAILALCFAGILEAVEGGKNPGYVSPYTFHPYPTEAVTWTCGIMIAEALGLYFILRPLTFAHHPRRALIALAVFGFLWGADFFFIGGWTDQAGYAYANGFFLRYVLLFLGVLFIISLSDDLGRRKLTPHDQPNDAAEP